MPLQLVNEGDEKYLPMQTGGIVQGSLSRQSHGFIMAYIKNALGQTADSRSTRLAKVLACANVACIQQDLVGENVSGPLFGLRIDTEGAHWQEDMAYIPWNPEHLSETVHRQPDREQQTLRTDSLPLVGCYVREDILCLKSMINGTSEFFPYQDQIDGTWPDLNSWLSRHSNELFSDSNYTKLRFYALLPSRPGCTVGGEVRHGEIIHKEGKTRLSDRLQESMNNAVINRLRFINGDFSENEGHTLVWRTEHDPTRFPLKTRGFPSIAPTASCPCGSGLLHRSCHSQIPAIARARINHR